MRRAQRRPFLRPGGSPASPSLCHHLAHAGSRLVEAFWVAGARLGELLVQPSPRPLAAAEPVHDSLGDERRHRGRAVLLGHFLDGSGHVIGQAHRYARCHTTSLTWYAQLGRSAGPPVIPPRPVSLRTASRRTLEWLGTVATLTLAAVLASLLYGYLSRR